MVTLKMDGRKSNTKIISYILGTPPHPQHFHGSWSIDFVQVFLEVQEVLEVLGNHILNPSQDHEGDHGLLDNGSQYWQYNSCCDNMGCVSGQTSSSAPTFDVICYPRSHTREVSTILGPICEAGYTRISLWSWESRGAWKTRNSKHCSPWIVA